MKSEHDQAMHAALCELEDRLDTAKAMLDAEPSLNAAQATAHVLIGLAGIFLVGVRGEYPNVEPPAEATAEK